MKLIVPGLIRQIFLLCAILSVCGLVLWQILPYISGILGALTLFVVVENWSRKLRERGWNRILTASVLMLLSFIVIFVPIIAFVLMLGGEIGNLADRSETVIQTFKEQVFHLEKFIDYDISERIDPPGLSSWLGGFLKGFLGGTATSIISIALMYFLLYYMLVDTERMKRHLKNYIPVGWENLDRIATEGRAKIRANAIGIPLVALAQGLVALVGFLLLGVQDAAFWAAVVAIGSMIPFVGSALGILPVFIISLGEGQDFPAWAVLVYGAVVVASTDNLIRLYLLKKIDDIHPLITLIGVLIGIPLFGFIGLIFGPLLLSLLFVMLKIYRLRYTGHKGGEVGTASGTGPEK